MQWTGNAATGSAGDTSAAFKEAVRARINYFRAMAGVPAGVVLNSLYSAKAQQAALMVSANNQLNQATPASWTFFTTAGAEGAGNSNLVLGETGAESITAQLRGDGDSNTHVAHRRWLLYPWTRAMGTGDVPATSSFKSANATWVLDTANFSGPRPITRDPFVAWPPSGFIPYQVVFPRWSFSFPGADFSAATVTMTRGDTSIPVRLEAVSPGAGENTIAWVYDNLDARLATVHPKPAADTTYAVTISAVRGSGVPAVFSYSVTVFDPEKAAGDQRYLALYGRSTPLVGVGNPYNFFKPALATAAEWRVVQLSEFSNVFGAEGDLQGVLVSTSGSYNVRDTSQPGNGAAAYRLVQQTGEPQILLLPGTYFSPLGTPGALSFRSRLGVSADQTARVQISLDDGGAWRDIWTQAGGNAEVVYRTNTVSLAEFAGRTIRLRFLLSGLGTARIDPTTSWLVDDITLVRTRVITTDGPATVGADGVFRYTPPAVGAVGLQARGVTPGNYAQEWSLVVPVVAVAADGAGDPGRLVNLSIRVQAGTDAQTLIMGLTIGGTGTGGNKSLLVRGVGPSLAEFGVTGFLTDPVMAVRSGSSVLADNDNWGNNAQVSAAGTQVGAFPFASTSSRDAALVVMRPAGGYTVQISGVGGTTGIALAEAYDVTAPGGFTATSPRLINVSARAQVGTGGEVLIAGFSIGGTSEKTVLIRAVGPALAVFGVDGYLVDPKLELYSSGGNLLGENDNWPLSSAMAFATGYVGAFELPMGSRDAALIATLRPGSYTVQVSGVLGTTGVGLVEVYEVF